MQRLIKECKKEITILEDEIKSFGNGGSRLGRLNNLKFKLHELEKQQRRIKT